MTTGGSVEVSFGVSTSLVSTSWVSGVAASVSLVFFSSDTSSFVSSFIFSSFVSSVVVVLGSFLGVLSSAFSVAMVLSVSPPSFSSVVSTTSGFSSDATSLLDFSSTLLVSVTSGFSSIFLFSVTSTTSLSRLSFSIGCLSSAFTTGFSVTSTTNAVDATGVASVAATVSSLTVSSSFSSLDVSGCSLATTSSLATTVSL